MKNCGSRSGSAGEIGGGPGHDQQTILASGLAIDYRLESGIDNIALGT
jgi:hypothetical protein